MNTRFHRFLLAVALWAALCANVSAQPLISLQPQAILDLLLGSSATFQVGATSAVTTNLQYQWFRNGVRIPGQTNSSLTINNAQATDCGAFSVRVNDGIGVVESETAGLTVNILNLVGDTLLNLLSLTNGQIRSSNSGDVNVLGDPDIVPGDPGGSTAWYYWTPLVSGVATFTTEGSDFDTVMGVYTGSAPSHLTAVPTAINNDDGGGYLCSRVAFKASALTTYVIGVDGYYGTQGNIVLTWDVAVGDTLPAASTTLAAATAPPTNEVQLASPWPGNNCDWLFNNVVVASNTNVLTITNLDDSTVGAYTARFTTANGSIAYARPTSLQVNTIQDGTTVSNSFAWNKFRDSANSVYAPTGTPQKMSGGGDTRGYSVSQVYSTQGNSDEPGEPIVCNQDGGSPSWYTYVTPSAGSMVINTAGSSFNTILGVFVGNGNSFSTLTNIGCGYTTNYNLDGQPIVTIPNVPAHQTNYIVVEGENGASGTVHLNIKLGAPVSINSAPTNQCAVPGTNVTLAVGATGATPLSFTWQFNGTNIPGATNAILTLSNVDESYSGSYSVVVSNQISVASAQAIVSIIDPPSILGQPLSQTCCVGSIAAFNCAVGGSNPLIYQWQHAGTNLDSATNSSLSLANVQMSDAGAYSCMVSNLTGVAMSSTATLTVTPITPIVTWSNPASLIYGSALTYSQLNAIASVPGTFAYSLPTGTILTAGTQTLLVVFAPTDSVNYSIVTDKVSIVVSPAPLTVTALNRSKTYGQSMTFSGSEFTATGLVNGDTVTGVTLASAGSGATAMASASPYTIIPSAAVGAGLGNYSISYVSGSLTVNPAPLTITANNRSKSYGQSVALAGTEFTVTGLANSDAVSSVSLTSSGAAATASLAGSPYNIIASAAVGSGLGNYTISYADGVLTISPATLTITANNRTKTYAQNVTFAGTEFTVNGLLNNDSVNSITLSSAGVNETAGVAGSPYSIVPSAAIGTGLGNYAFNYVNGALTVNEAASTLTWLSPASIVYGTPLTATQLNALANVPGTFAYTPTNGAILNVGSNTLSVVFTPTDISDYEIVTNLTSLVVLPAPLKIVANNSSRSYGQANPAFSGAITGVTNGDNITASYSTAATTNSPLGNYNIVPTLVDPNNRQTNYAISLVDGTLTVTRAMPIVTWTNPVPMTYGMALNATQLNATANAAGAFIYLPTNGSVLDSGTNNLSVVFTPADSADYATVTNSVNLLVSPAPLTITVSNASRAYGQENPQLFGTITGLTNADNISVDYACSATNTSTVGSYPIVATLVDPANRQTNYAVTLIDGTLTISQAAPIVSWNSSASIIYGTPLNASQLNATGNMSGSFTYTPPLGTVLNAGTNLLSVTFMPDDSTNYSSATDTTSLVVTAPQAVQRTLPTLQSSVQNGLLVLSWSTNAPNATLEMTTDLLAGWVPVTNSIVDGDHFIVTANMTGVAAFFRLNP